ncbi:GH25 family lysozyme [Latilactobacillus sakei]
MTLNLFDVASYQVGMDVGAVASDGVIVKATGGTGYVNPYCNTHVEQTLNAGKKLGLYHFAHEKGYQGSAEQEAEFFLKSIKNYVGKAMLILDFESDNQYDVTWAKSWLDYVYNSTGVRPVLYLGLGTENAVNWLPVVNANYGLWVAQYNNYNIVSGYQPRELYGNLRSWKSMAMFQYTSTGRLSGWNKNLDFNVFYGDAKAWDAYTSVSGAPKPQPKPTPAPKPNAPKAWVDALGVKWTEEDGTFTPKGVVNLRWGASTSSSIITTLQPGNAVKYDAKCVSGGYVWVRQPRSNGYGYCAVGKADAASNNVDPYGTFE